MNLHLVLALVVLFPADPVDPAKTTPAPAQHRLFGSPYGARPVAPGQDDLHLRASPYQTMPSSERVPITSPYGAIRRGQTEAVPEPMLQPLVPPSVRGRTNRGRPTYLPSQWPESSGRPSASSGPYIDPPLPAVPMTKGDRTAPVPSAYRMPYVSGVPAPSN